MAAYFMKDSLDPIVADRFAAGGILAALKLARRCSAQADFWMGSSLTATAAFSDAMNMVRSLVWDVVDDACDVNRSQNHADAVMESLGLSGLTERVNAIDHYRQFSLINVGELVREVDEQLTGAITRLKSALADAAACSN